MYPFSGYIAFLIKDIITVNIISYKFKLSLLISKKFYESSINLQIHIFYINFGL